VTAKRQQMYVRMLLAGIRKVIFPFARFGNSVAIEFDLLLLSVRPLGAV
jgi:hypothetical protein